MLKHKKTGTLNSGLFGFSFDLEGQITSIFIC